MPNIVRYGSKGADALLCQKCLKNAGFYPYNLDGVFGTYSVGSVLKRTGLKGFQLKYGHTPDGIAGSKTWPDLLKFQPKPTPTPTPKPTPNPGAGVYLESSWNDDDQDTDYTCGPTSSAMALSTLGVYTTEAEMAKEEGTTKRGTPHAGIIKGCINEAQQKGITLQAQELTLTRIGGFKGLGEVISNPNKAVIAHGNTKGWPTYYKGTYGHYVFPVKVDINQSRISIADPARKATLIYSFNEFKAGLDLVSQPSFIVLEKK